MQAPILWAMVQFAGGLVVIGAACLLVLIAAIWLRGWIGR
jgi:hypothetical protein